MMMVSVVVLWMMAKVEGKGSVCQCKKTRLRSQWMDDGQIRHTTSVCAPFREML